MWNGQQVWSVSRYQDIRAALVDPRLSAETLPDLFDAASGNEAPPIFARIDDPEHHRLRRMMTSQFTFRRTEAMRPQIQELVDGYLDAMIDKGPPADIVRDFGLPVPSMVIALLLGVPPEDLELFQHNTSLGLDVKSTDEERAQGFIAMYAYIQELVARKERDPGDDLISRLITDYVATGQLDYNTVAVNAVIMMQAGHETTANMIGLGTVALLEHPEAAAALRADPALMPAATDEMLRWWTPVMTFRRTATADCELGGQVIRAGEKVVVSFTSANRDEAVFADPGRFDIRRQPNPHLVFGHGPHFCLGAHLARTQMRALFAEVLARTSVLEAAGPPAYLRSNFQRGVKRLPLAWAA